MKTRIDYMTQQKIETVLAVNHCKYILSNDITKYKMIYSGTKLLSKTKFKFLKSNTLEVVIQ